MIRYLLGAEEQSNAVDGRRFCGPRLEGLRVGARSIGPPFRPKEWGSVGGVPGRSTGRCRERGPHMPRILVVDDEKANRVLLRACLEDKVTSIVEASSGEEALALVRLGGLDLVLLDVMMPGLDGFETTRLIKEIAGE